MADAKALWRIISSPGTGDDPLSIASLRRGHFISLLSISEAPLTSTDQALALSNNGYVVFLKCLQNASLSTRACLAVRSIPRTIRNESSAENFDAILQAPPEDFIAARSAFTPVDPVDPFCGEEYIGVEPRTDPFGYQIRHSLTATRRDLNIMTFLQSGETSGKEVQLDWLGSVHAVAAAFRMNRSRTYRASPRNAKPCSIRKARCWTALAGLSQVML
jgi:hypothetical protein